jgi:mono/diheme cytochrome c family protein
MSKKASGETKMTTCRQVLLMLAPTIMLAAPASAQQPPAPAHKGLEIIKAKCFQCHTDAMWRDQRQDARAWEANLYRMVGRGALWTTDEIKTMADYLGTDFGSNVPPVAPPAR